MQREISIDAFVGCKGGIWEPLIGKDSLLWHYMWCFNKQVVLWVVHNKFSSDANAKLEKCKAFSGFLCEYPLITNANKCILVQRQDAIHTFVGKYKGHILSRCALLLSQNIDNASLLADRIGEDKVLDEERKKLMSNFLE